MRESDRSLGIEYPGGVRCNPRSNMGPKKKQGMERFRVSPGLLQYPWRIPLYSPFLALTLPPRFVLLVALASSLHPCLRLSCFVQSFQMLVCSFGMREIREKIRDLNTPIKRIFARFRCKSFSYRNYPGISFFG